MPPVWPHSSVSRYCCSTSIHSTSVSSEPAGDKWCTGCCRDLKAVWPPLPLSSGSFLGVQGMHNGQHMLRGWGEQSSVCHAWKDWLLSPSDRWSVPLRECGRQKIGRVCGQKGSRARLLGFPDWHPRESGKHKSKKIKKQKCSFCLSSGHPMGKFI